MKRGHGFCAALVAGGIAVAAGCAREPAPEPAAAAPAEAPAAAVDTELRGAGWTGLTNPAEVIEARRGLMDELERLIKPIDLYTIGEPAEPEALRSAAVSISRMLLAVPHLFPPTTNLYDPSVLDPPTAALPAVWRTFNNFVALSERAEEAATHMTAVDDPEALRDAARAVRASCDACHAVYLKMYTPPQVKPEDVEFDFDSVLPNN